MVLARFLPACVVSLVLAASSAAQTRFDDCGTLVTGTYCKVLFQADQGGLYTFVNDSDGFQAGDRVHVVGLLPTSCVPICQQGDGCIQQENISLCAPGSVPYCFGDGSGTPCPCGNVGAPGRGCPNSESVRGARLAAYGSASVSADTLVLSGSGMPNGRTLYYQATHTPNGGAGQLFGDGLRCISGANVRLGTRVNANGASQYPQPGEPSISVRGMVSPGHVRFYQVQYTNQASFCTAATYNFTNGMQVTWGV